jgi:NADH:ubiquinone oxidoreductase subunit 3 (subunit A)
MEYYLLEYRVVFLSILLASSFSLLIFSISYLFVPRFYNIEKIAPYECGFDPFEDSRTRFDVRFYLVAILFIVFDLEIIYLLPWSVSTNVTGFFGFSVGLFFVTFLTIGFIYEIWKGAIDANEG